MSVPAAYLSSQWCATAAEVLGAVAGPGPTLTVQWSVTKGPGGDAAFTWVMFDGEVRAVRPGGDPEADVVLTATYPEHLAITRGERSAAVAFMQGRLKAVGHTGLLMALLRRMAEPPFAAALAELGARSEVPAPT